MQCENEPGIIGTPGLEITFKRTALFKLLNGRFLSNEDRPRHCRNFCCVCLAPAVVSSTRTLCRPCAQVIDHVLMCSFANQTTGFILEGGKGRNPKQQVFRVPAWLVPAKILPLRSHTGRAANTLLLHWPFSLRCVISSPNQSGIFVSDMM